VRKLHGQVGGHVCVSGDDPRELRRLHADASGDLALRLLAVSDGEQYGLA
jgi:hypothetical protein